MKKEYEFIIGKLYMHWEREVVFMFAGFKKAENNERLAILLSPDGKIRTPTEKAAYFSLRPRMEES